MLKISEIAELKIGDIIKFEDATAWWMFEIYEMAPDPRRPDLLLPRGQLIN